MPGILHTHLWGADSSLSLWKQLLGCSLLLESAASCRARRCSPPLFFHRRTLKQVMRLHLMPWGASRVIMLYTHWHVWCQNCKPPTRLVGSLKGVSLARGGKMGCFWPALQMVGSQVGRWFELHLFPGGLPVAKLSPLALYSPSFGSLSM